MNEQEDTNLLLVDRTFVDDEEDSKMEIEVLDEMCNSELAEVGVRRCRNNQGHCALNPGSDIFLRM